MTRLALSLAALLAIAAPAAARGPHDGVWLVTTTTASGLCEPSQSFYVFVADGELRPGARAVEASGRVDARGGVRGALSAQGFAAEAVGRLQGAAGQGTWSSPNAGCSGTWTAERMKPGP